MWWNIGSVQAQAVFALMACLALCMALTLMIASRRLKEERKERERAVKEMEAARAACEVFERMIPGAFLELLEIKSYSELKVGTHQYFFAVIMDVNRSDFSSMVHNKKTDEVFASVNGMLGRAIPAISGHGGLIDSFEGGGFKAVFMDSGVQALTAAVSMQEEINATGNEEYATVTVGLTMGLVMIGAVGHEGRVTVLLLSEAKELAGFLRHAGYGFYAKILVTKDLLDSMRGEALRFNSRILGKIYIRSKKSSMVVCDIFDGDRVEVRNKKRRTRIVFEKGVELFWSQKLEQARQHFVEVLKMDAADRAAAFYLLRCDGCLHQEEKWQEHIMTF